MRENGLRAAGYVAIADLHPQVADVMLDALATAGIAAYAQPVTGSRTLAMTPHLPNGPVDRLYVDRGAELAARAVVDRDLPAARAALEHPDGTMGTAPDRDDGLVPASPSGGAGPASDTRPVGPVDEPAASVGPAPIDDDTWGRLVAAYLGSAPAGGSSEGLWPEAEDLRTEPRDVDASSTESPVDFAWPAAPDTRASGADEDVDADQEDRYVPPPPPPLPTADSTTRLAWAGVIGGPLLLLLSVLLDWDLDSWAQLVGVGALVIGFVTLVARMRDDPEDPGGDNGAVV